MKNAIITGVVAATILTAGCGRKSPIGSNAPPPAPTDAASGLSAHIAAATNRVSTLRDLEFSIVINNGTPTNVTIHPWTLINGLGTVTVYDAKGLILAQLPEPHFVTKPPTRAGIDAKPPSDLVLKPGESYALKYKLGAYIHAIPPGRYVAREGFIPSNDVEITIE
jgi:predicted small lipoprotein YifL